jgi:hypothetical protein
MGRTAGTGFPEEIHLLFTTTFILTVDTTEVSS